MKNTEKIQNVCRRFVLHNDFLPPTCKLHNWPYFAFGYYDGFSVGENLFNGVGELSVQQLWEDSRRQTREMDEMAMCQIVYGFRDENEITKNRDSEFWKEQAEDENYPFIFFVLIQFESQGREHLADLYKEKEIVEAGYTVEGSYKGIMYLTLENSDLLFVIRSKGYEMGARVVDGFHRKNPFYKNKVGEWKVKYSFTVAAIDKMFLREPEKLQNNQEKIENVYIYATERYGGSIDAYYLKLIECLPLGVKRRKESVLGYNDELIILSDITWNDLLMLYKLGSGLLNHTNHVFQVYVSGLTTIVGLKQEELNENPGMEAGVVTGDLNEREVRVKFSAFAERHARELEKVNSGYKALHQNMMFSLYNLINSFARFDNSPVRENLFFPASYTICQLILMLKEMLGEDNCFTGKKECYREYQSFLNGLNLYAQNWVRSDRQFTQSLDFNIRIYNLPVILNAVYNAFIFYVKECLNGVEGSDTHHAYEFLTCPGAAPDMVVTELFIGMSQKMRLFLISIPENQSYNPELMFIMLCHEVAHFVGAQIRNRPLRFELLSQAFCRMVMLYFRCRLGDLEKPALDEYWDEFERKLVLNVQTAMGQYFTIEYMKRKYEKKPWQSDMEYEKNIEKLLQKEEAERFYSRNVRENLLACMSDTIREDGKQYFGQREYLEYMEAYRYGHDKAEAELALKTLQKKIQNASVELFQVHSNAQDLVNVENMLSNLMMLFRECLSDVIGIVLLQLTYPQYLDALIQNLSDQGSMEILTDVYFNTTLIRMGLVCGAMIQKKNGEDAGYGWNATDLEASESFAGKEESVFARMVKAVREFIYNYLMNNKSIEESNVVTGYLLDGKLLRYIKQYLFVSRVTLEKHLKSREENRNKVMEMFRLIRSESVSEVLLGFHAVVDEYREEIHMKMEQLSNESIW